MNKENKLVPQLRFPEFVNEGEWEEKELEKVCLNISSGKDKNFIGGEFDLYGSTGIIGKSENANYDGDFILIARVGANAGLLNRVNGKFGVTDNTLVLHLKKTTVIDFIFYSLDKIGLNKLVFGSGQPLITGGQLKSLKLLFPKLLQEQQKIASCLSSLDELIAAESQKLEVLKEHKKGLMQNLFPQEGETVPKLRFKEFVNDGDWEDESLEKRIELLSGIPLKSEELSDDPSGTPILRGINITEGYIRHSKDIDKYFLGDVSNINKYLVKEDDIVIGMDGSKVGKNVALIKKEDNNSILIQRVARIRTNKKNNIKFVYQYFISDKFRGYVDTVNTSSGIPHISAQQIKDFKIGFPPKVLEQQKIADCLSSLDALIQSQGEKIEALKLHKKGLMQGLFPQSAS